MSTEIIKIPDIGGAEGAEVIELCVAVGDSVAQEDSLVVLETDKASMEVPSPVAGKVVSINMNEGDSVSEGDVILELEISSTSAPEETPQEEPEQSKQEEPETQTAEPVAQEQGVSVETISAPDLGGADNAEVIETCVAVGDEIAEGDSMIVLETDKASMEIPAPKAGKVSAIHVSDGSSISQGDAILELEVAGQPAAVASSEPSAVKTEESVQTEEVTPVPVAAGGVSIESITVPDLGGATDVDVIEVCVAVNDNVDEGASLIVLETDKASMEIPAPKAGKVVALKVEEGATVNVGDVIVELEVEGAVSVAPTEQKTTSPDVATKAPAPSAAAQPAKAPPQSVSDTARSTSQYAGPAVRKICREFGVELDQVPGTGPKGRVLKEDVQAYVKTSLANKTTSPSVVTGMGIPQVPEVDFAQFGDIDVQKMSKLHRLTSMNMQRAWLNVPHVTQFDDADITDLEAFRKGLKPEAERRGVKVTPLPFLVKACAATLSAHPQFNASLHADGEHIVYKNYVHIGVAMDTPAGLVVPVVRDANKKSIWELAAELAELGVKAKERKLTPAEMQGGCFTISSLGGIGGQGFTPIVNTPEVAILGVSKLAVKPVWDGTEFVPRQMLPLSLSYDHRAVNGADAGRFFTDLGEILADIRRLAL